MPVWQQSQQKVFLQKRKLKRQNRPGVLVIPFFSISLLKKASEETAPAGKKTLMKLAFQKEDNCIPQLQFYIN